MFLETLENLSTGKLRRKKVIVGTGKALVKVVTIIIVIIIMGNIIIEE